MYIQGVDNVYDLDFNGQGVTYGEVFKRAEVRIQRTTTSNSRERGDAVPPLPGRRGGVRTPCWPQGLALPAYDQCIKASHRFNLLDARGAISVTERAAYIGRVRALAKGCCEAWIKGGGLG